MLFRFLVSKIPGLSLFIFIAFISFSCMPARKAIFFNGMVPGKDSVDKVAEEIAKQIYPGDRISLTIVFEHPDMSLFNAGQSASNGGVGNTNIQSGGGSGYLVDKDGNIEIVKLGVLHVAGMTPEKVAEEVKSKVSVLYKDPSVYCSLNGRVLFLGMGSPGAGGGANTNSGVVPIMNDRLTILEALALRGIGDPTAVRDRVWVIREKGEIREFATIDVNSKDVFKSPYFYLRNNDIIYLEPNRVNTFLAVNEPIRSILGTFVSTLAIILSLWALLR